LLPYFRAQAYEALIEKGAKTPRQWKEVSQEYLLYNNAVRLTAYLGGRDLGNSLEIEHVLCEATLQNFWKVYPEVRGYQVISQTIISYINNLFCSF